ncbi:hypothetical protein [Tomitella biformata]|uniref:hypothetical protein n=1 Tax=Tomitella biformata TaxID=630403 RepID=UPI0009FD9191|nr:hypothetical protein [Tomitella biformata]
MFPQVGRVVAAAGRVAGRAGAAKQFALFEDHYNAAARPFKWKFSTTGLAEFLARLDQHTLDDNLVVDTAA